MSRNTSLVVTSVRTWPAACARATRTPSASLDGLQASEIEVLDRFGAAAKATLTRPPQAFDLEAALR